MSEAHDNQALQKIKSTHERAAITAGTIMAVTLCIYFFSFSALIDAGASGLVWFEVVTSVLFLFGLIFLKRLAFFITRIVLSRNPACRRALSGMAAADVDKIAPGADG